MTEREPIMAETTDQPTSPVTPETWQWAFSYLRQDIQEIRTDLRELRGRIGHPGQKPKARIRELDQQLSARIAESCQKPSTRVDESCRQLCARIDELSRRMTTMFTWLIATTLATSVVTMGVVAALIKL